LKRVEHIDRPKKRKGGLVKINLIERKPKPTEKNRKIGLNGRLGGQRSMKQQEKKGQSRSFRESSNLANRHGGTTGPIRKKSSEKGQIKLVG